MFNDGLLALDEISECEPREIGQVVYMLGNGRGKQRANRYGSARSVTRWRCFVLSSGERGISTAMAEGGYRSKAGQSVRLLDVPTTRTWGAWDELHGHVDGRSFSDSLKRAVGAHYGHAGRFLLENLTRDQSGFCAMLEKVKGDSTFSVVSGEGQEKRAAGRFALIALAKDRISEIQPRDRAGWWEDDATGQRTYMFTSSGIREALKGHDFKRALDVLQEARALPLSGADSKRAKFYRIGGRGMKLYPICYANLESGHVA